MRHFVGKGISMRDRGSGKMLVASAMLVLLSACGTSAAGTVSPTQFYSEMKNPPPGHPGLQALSTVIKRWGVCLQKAGVDFQHASGKRLQGNNYLVTFRSGEQYEVTGVGSNSASAVAHNPSAQAALDSATKTDPGCELQSQQLFGG